MTQVSQGSSGPAPRILTEILDEAGDDLVAESMGLPESMIPKGKSTFGLGNRECVFFFGCLKQIQDDFRGLYHPILSGIHSYPVLYGNPVTNQYNNRKF